MMVLGGGRFSIATHERFLYWLCFFGGGVVSFYFLKCFRLLGFGECLYADYIIGIFGGWGIVLGNVGLKIWFLVLLMENYC